MRISPADRPTVAKKAAEASEKSSAQQTWLRALALTGSIEKKSMHVLPDVVQELAARFGGAPALLSATERLSFAQLAQRANRYARWALAQRIGKGDVVVLLMPNRPDYLATWVGITAIGGVVALININLRGQSLAHCLNLAAGKHIIIASELIDALATAMPLQGEAKVWVRDGGAGQGEGKGGGKFARLDEAVARISGTALTPEERRGVTLDDRALYMYTSGTTGLPKAAIIDHRRLMTWSLWFAGMMDTRPTDCMYNCLPLYHSVGGVVATGAVLVGGGSVYIAEKFSASQFWDDPDPYRSGSSSRRSSASPMPLASSSSIALRFASRYDRDDQHAAPRFRLDRHARESTVVGRSGLEHDLDRARRAVTATRNAWAASSSRNRWLTDASAIVGLRASSAAAVLELADAVVPPYIVAGTTRASLPSSAVPMPTGSSRSPPPRRPPGRTRVAAPSSDACDPAASTTTSYSSARAAGSEALAGLVLVVVARREVDVDAATAGDRRRPPARRPAADHRLRAPASSSACRAHGPRPRAAHQRADLGADAAGNGTRQLRSTITSSANRRRPRPRAGG